MLGLGGARVEAGPAASGRKIVRGRCKDHGEELASQVGASCTRENACEFRDNVRIPRQSVSGLRIHIPFQPARCCR
jgi:hypothetical protein